ncbi:hypothetical protein DFH94DRAFT_671918 [Russula ochroleuca]|uniref:Uncharacterized protein n=1 Tax=Russula ochroleuca TaxID=152965 RepID=A0A9P5JUJ3_9AGAM|nr:hypothetical protein DFH94DRAFT_677657 [Russula ochroleuca]KAF8477685.1 hypothetical protein DFH94DRAFT_671918 [Russula ochroleuca]
MSVLNSERSTSRGRANGFQLTGRGGAGNFRSPSREPATNGPEDYSDTRGRDPIPSRDPDVISIGRGGAGNIRSPSRDAIRVKNQSPESSPIRSELRGRGYDRDLITAIDNAHDTGYSTGRGGIGNMTNSPSNSQSRSRSRELAHTAGRGGVGNAYIGGPTEKVIEEVDESERAAHQHLAGMYSSGRGGVGNLTAGEAPYREGSLNPHGVNHPHATHSHDAESFGRGGSGNIYRDPSREPGVKNTRNPLSGFLHGLAHGSGGNSKGEQRGRSIGREGDLVATG